MSFARYQRLSSSPFQISSVPPTAQGMRDVIFAWLAEFNRIILEEASKRQLKSRDVFPQSGKCTTTRSLIARDGLHPSAKEYALWKALFICRPLELCPNRPAECLN